MSILIHTAELVPAATAVMRWEPEVSPDFSDLAMADLPAFLVAAMLRGNTRAETLISYLDERNCPFGPETIRLVLDNFNGFTAAKSLWLCLPDGNYSPLNGTDF